MSSCHDKAASGKMPAAPEVTVPPATATVDGSCCSSKAYVVPTSMRSHSAADSHAHEHGHGTTGRRDDPPRPSKKIPCAA